MATLCLLTSFALVSLIILVHGDSVEDGLSKSDDWDVLIFTQHWPATVCYEWKNKNSSHSCSFPSQRNVWTVHGIWPTKLGTRGPNFCNNQWKFNQSLIQPIESQMEQSWTNIEKDTPLYSLWEHEWSKHGTCAAAHSPLNDEMKYFAQGIRWLQLYSMGSILGAFNVVPNSTIAYDSMKIYNIVKNHINKNPSMHCVVDSKTGTSYLFEIRICFDKRLELVDCDGITDSFGKGNLNHCDLTKPVHYIDVVPNIKRSVSNEWVLVEVYKFINWLRWYTL